MNENELEEMAEKTMASGEIMTLARTKGGFDVDQWGKDGNNRWHRFYKTIEEAQAEYNKWN
jgi:hypothetical protein